jgi:pimeloyl-ACP methyl ester carboxylesterase
LLEIRAALDLASVPFSLIKSKLLPNSAAGSLPIIMFPGFGTDERYLKALEYYLQNLGYTTEGWGLGANLAGLDIEHKLEELSPIWELDYPENYSPDTYKGEGGVPVLCEKAIDRVKKRSDELGSPVVIIGWSLGGYIARECARELPDEVAQIITFGAPVVGGPKYSRAVDYFKAKGFDLDWIERSVDKRNSKLITQPITCIYSKSDGIVAEFSAIDHLSPNVNNIEINAAHLGMGFNQKIWGIVSDSLLCETQSRLEL